MAPTYDDEMGGDDVRPYLQGLSNDLGVFFPPNESAHFGPGVFPWHEPDANGLRLRRFAETLGFEESDRTMEGYDWVGDPRRAEQEQLLREAGAGHAEDPVAAPFDLLWQTLMAVVRADRFNDGLIAAHSLALTRIANELRRRLLADHVTGRPAAYRPFGGDRGPQIRSQLASGSSDLRAFADLRRRISGRDLELVGLQSLIETEPGLEGRLVNRILPAVVRWAHLLIADGAPGLPLPRAGQPSVLSLRRSAVAGWVAHMLLGSLPRPPGDSCSVDFSPLLAASAPAEQAKLRCVLAYFDRLADTTPSGSLEIRRVVTPVRRFDDWAADATPLSELVVEARGAIEDAKGHRQVDFANQYIGGGVLSGGNVQEEILFASCPELLVSAIVTPRMLENEAVVIRGYQCFARTAGYGASLRYAGPWEDTAGCLADGTPDTEVVAIDAMDYRGRDARVQFTVAAMLRELGKARTGFRADERQLPVATGNWGCGAFGGDPLLKALLQWMAASAEQRPVRYFTFGDDRVEALERFARSQRGSSATVGSLWIELVQVLEGGCPAACWQPIRERFAGSI